MVQQIYDERQLLIGELEKIGLAKDGRVNLNGDDLAALLSGRRTEMITLEGLSAEGVQIPKLDAKLSVRPNAAGELELLIHPIYKKAEAPKYLTAAEAEKLERGKVVNIEKTIIDFEGKMKDILVEFDKETNEFIFSDTANLLVPDMVNNEKLTPDQKERYRKGKEVQLSDGTTFRYSGTESKGITANRLALVASILIDGGVSYLLFRGLKSAFGKKNEAPEIYSKGYIDALKDMENNALGKTLDQHYESHKQNSRGFSRTGYR